MPTSFPFDFEATMNLPDWQQKVCWPVSAERRMEAATQSYLQHLNLVEQWENDGERHIITLAIGQLTAIARILIEALLVFEEEDDGNGNVLSTHPVINDLRSAAEEAPVAGFDMASIFKPMASPRHTWLRRLVRTATWTPLWRLPQAIIAPEVTVINHNPLLIAEAEKSGLRINYRHAESFLSDARSMHASPVLTEKRREDITESLLTALMNIDGIKSHRINRAKGHLRPLLISLLEQADRDLASLSKLKKMPSQLWAGTGGYYPSRATGLEVQRRGGIVTRFEHGFSTGLVARHEALVSCDLSVCDRYVTTSKKSAQSLERDPALTIIPKSRRPEIIGGNGDPHITIKRRRVKQGKRLTVLYGPTILKGFREFYPPILPDPIHIDWQMRLVKMLTSMPIDLIFRPHPEGLLKGQAHPASKYVPASPVPYEQSIEEADVLLFDHGDSTTLATALCSEIPVVLILWDNPPFNDLGQKMLADRCRILNTSFDEKNRPILDEAELRDGLLCPFEKAKPELFQKYLMI